MSRRSRFNFVDLYGSRYNLIDFCTKYKIPYKRTVQRINNFWSLEDALFCEKAGPRGVRGERVIPPWWEDIVVVDNRNRK